jgi:hypothetical protein
MIGKLRGRASAEGPPSANAHGSLDSPENGQINGWAFDPDHAGARMVIDFLVDGQPFQSMEASAYRSDLLAAGVGDGFHAFLLTVPEAFLDGKPHRLEAKIAGPNKSLQHSPRTVVFSRPLTAPNVSTPAATSSGQVPHARTLPESVLRGLSVVIATKDNPVQLERTLRACAPFARNLPIEFVVVDYGVDYGSAGETAQRLKTLEAEIPSLRCIAAPGTSAGLARNAGVEIASRELILFLGDAVCPTVPTFFEQHINAHRMLPGRNIAVLGKIIWPNLPDDRVSFLMAHLQGAGEQQFGFHSLLPYTWLDWRFFSPENVSFKRSVVADWQTDGYRPDSSSALIQDPEFAYRLQTKLEGGFPILYCPAASVSHENSFTVRQFIDRQVSAGMASRTLIEQHAGAAEKLGIEKLERLLASKDSRATASTEDLLRIIEGAKSWGVVIESNYRLGSQNWHADLLNAIFELSYLQGYVMGCATPNANFAAGYRYCIERFQEKLSTAAAFEVFGRFPSLTVT